MRNSNSPEFTEPKFQETQQYFMEKYWEEFDATDENKLIYMDIFEEYVSYMSSRYKILQIYKKMIGNFPF